MFAEGSPPRVTFRIQYSDSLGTTFTPTYVLVVWVEYNGRSTSHVRQRDKFNRCGGHGSGGYVQLDFKQRGHTKSCGANTAGYALYLFGRTELIPRSYSRTSSNYSNFKSWYLGVRRKRSLRVCSSSMAKWKIVVELVVICVSKSIKNDSWWRPAPNGIRRNGSLYAKNGRLDAATSHR